MINELIKEAMKSKDKESLAAYRAIKTKILNEMTKKGEKPNNDEKLFLSMVQKEIKERKEANSFIQDENNSTRLGNEATIRILEKHLPKQLSEEEQISLVKKVVEELGTTDPKDMGKVMGKLKSEHQNEIDMKMVSSMVKSALAEVAG